MSMSLTTEERAYANDGRTEVAMQVVDIAQAVEREDRDARAADRLYGIVGLLLTADEPAADALGVIYSLNLLDLTWKAEEMLINWARSDDDNDDDDDAHATLRRLATIEGLAKAYEAALEDLRAAIEASR